MPTSSEAVVGTYEPVLVPNQDYNRLEYEDSPPKLVNANTDALPEVPSGANATTKLSGMKIALIVGCVLFIIIAVAVIPAVLVTKVFTTTTISSSSSTLTSSSVSVSSNTTSSSSSSSNSSLSSSSSNSSTSSGSSTSACPTTTCACSTWYTLTSSGYYGVEHVDINCTQALSNISGTIYVQRTFGATFSSEYNNFWNGVISQGYYNTSSQLVYVWSTIANQTISSAGFPYYFEAQFQLQGINQTVINDTYSVTTQSTCGQVLTYSGHF